MNRSPSYKLLTMGSRRKEQFDDRISTPKSTQYVISDGDIGTRSLLSPVAVRQRAPGRGGFTQLEISRSMNMASTLVKDIPKLNPSYKSTYCFPKKTYTAIVPRGTSMISAVQVLQKTKLYIDFLHKQNTIHHNLFLLKRKDWLSLIAGCISFWNYVEVLLWTRFFSIVSHFFSIFWRICIIYAHTEQERQQHYQCNARRGYIWLIFWCNLESCTLK